MLLPWALSLAQLVKRLLWSQFITAIFSCILAPLLSSYPKQQHCLKNQVNILTPHIFSVIVHLSDFDCTSAFAFQKARDFHREHQAQQQLEEDRTCVAELLQHHGNGKPADAQRRQEALLHYTACREERVQDFLEALKHKRDSYFTDLCSQAISA